MKFKSELSSHFLNCDRYSSERARLEEMRRLQEKREQVRGRGGLRAASIALAHGMRRG